MSQTVLVVDDDDAIRSWVKVILEKDGYNVLAAGHGAEMFEVLSSVHIDILLLDLGLPDGDALPHIIKLRKESDFPIIILTARQRVDDRLMALGLGADDYLTKPIDPRELSLRIGKLLARSSGLPGPSPDTTAVISQRAKPPKVTRKRDRWNVYGLVLFAMAIGAVGYWVALPTFQEQENAKIEMTTDVDNTPSSPVEETSSLTVEKMPTAVPDVAPSTPTVSTTEPVTIKADSQVKEVAPVQANELFQSDEGSEEPELSKAEILGYGWVLASKCGPIPEVKWWKQNTHEIMANYVVRRQAGDWEAYLDGLVIRLAKLYDVADRKSSVVTTTGVTLRGDKLETYIQQFAQRLAVARCLASEASAAARNG